VFIRTLANTGQYQPTPALYRMLGKNVPTVTAIDAVEYTPISQTLRHYEYILAQNKANASQNDNT